MREAGHPPGLVFLHHGNEERGINVWGRAYLEKGFGDTLGYRLSAYAYPVHADAPCIFDGIQWPTTDYRYQRDKDVAALLGRLGVDGDGLFDLLDHFVDRGGLRVGEIGGTGELIQFDQADLVLAVAGSES